MKRITVFETSILLSYLILIPDSDYISKNFVEMLHGREAYAKRYPLGNPLGQRLYK
ncbi:MAG: hypothetical protein AB4372_22715 [Xenococcus sp. (in: cyanobacteria)]